MRIKGLGKIVSLFILVFPVLVLLTNSYVFSSADKMEAQEMIEQSFISINVETDVTSTFQFSDSSNVRFVLYESFYPNLEEERQKSFGLDLFVQIYNNERTIIQRSFILGIEVPNAPLEINKEYTNFTSESFHPDLYEPYKFFSSAVLGVRGDRYDDGEIESGKFILTELTTSYAKGEFEIVYEESSPIKRIEGEFTKVF